MKKRILLLMTIVALMVAVAVAPLPTTRFPFSVAPFTPTLTGGCHPLLL